MRISLCSSTVTSDILKQRSLCNERPAAGQWDSVSPPLSVAKCSDLSRSCQEIFHILFRHLTTFPRGATAKLVAPRLPKPCPGQAESTLTSDAFTTEEGKRKYQRLPSLFPPVSSRH